MTSLRALIVDDSAVNRRFMERILSEIPGVEVVGRASDGEDALRSATSLRPDFVTLDLEMPRMDGFTFLRLLMATQPTPVLVVSGYAAGFNVFRALELGATDFIPKPTGDSPEQLSAFRRELESKVYMVRQLRHANLVPERRDPTPTAVSGESEVLLHPPRTLRKLVVVGASTGGPTALLQLFGQLRHDMAASIVVAQHMPERFTQSFAARLGRASPFEVEEASKTHVLKPGTAWVCPGGRCMEVQRRDMRLSTRVVFPGADDRYVPSVDRLFESAAAALGDRVIAVILTGMGDDGSKGVQAVHRAGGTVLVESAETAVVFGMPRAAIRTGMVDDYLALPRLVQRVTRLLEV